MSAAVGKGCVNNAPQHVRHSGVQVVTGEGGGGVLVLRVAAAWYGQKPRPVRWSKQGLLR